MPAALHVSIATALVSTMCAGTARAQTGGFFAIGGQVTAMRPTNAAATPSYDVSLLWRFGHSDTGWGYDWALNWYDTEVTRSIAGAAIDVGDLHVRPLMVGYGYTYVRGRTAVSGSLLGGYAFASLAMRPRAADLYRDRFGARSPAAHASNTFVTKPQLTLWHDVSEKVGVSVSAGYILARPMVTIRSGAGSDRRRFRADMVSLKIGAVYSVF